MLLDANILLYAVDRSSPHHQVAARWLTSTLSSGTRVGLAWQTIGAFIRIVTHPRVMARPLAGADAWSFVEGWLSLDNVWLPTTTQRTAVILGRLVTDLGVTGNLLPDAQLAATAIEHGVVLVSADTDFARFPDVRWLNPLTQGREP
ncbi:MAG: type II toxin-antitoxin system VapC family toxin [Jiangellales bacterium]